MNCCQDVGTQKKSKKGEITQNRDNVGMDWFGCNGRLDIKVNPSKVHKGMLLVVVSISHEERHVPYINVEMPPAACDFIREHLYTAPITLIPEVTQQWPQVTPKQVYNAWVAHSAILWKKDNDQRVSATALLEELEKKGEVDMWQLKLPDGVEAFAWGMTPIGRQLQSKVVELALDATCKSCQE